MIITEPVDGSPRVPFVDLRLQNDLVAEDVRRAVAAVCGDGAFVLGPPVRAFEAEYAAFCGVEHCIGVGNGTDAIELALRAAGVGFGDEVIVPANTFIGTAEAVVRAGAELVLADCTEDFLIDPLSVADQMTERTKAVIGVDLYGQVAPFDRLRDVVGDDVLLIEDAAQSQGAAQRGRPAGSFGVVAATSFYPGKNLGAYGDAGAVTTDDGDLADRVRALRNHGGVARYEHQVVGTNSRLDSIQAAILSVKLQRLRGWNAQRAQAALLYSVLLSGLAPIQPPRVLTGNEHVWHLYVVRVPERDAVLQRLGDLGVDAGIHYPRPLHLLPAFAHLGLGVGSFPVAERLAGEIISLPMFPGISADQQRWVVAALVRAVQETGDISTEPTWANRRVLQ
jgi:dTDP-4-amino-4,6-dideoxygalactose transaminase